MLLRARSGGLVLHSLRYADETSVESRPTGTLGSPPRPSWRMTRLGGNPPLDITPRGPLPLDPGGPFSARRGIPFQSAATNRRVYPQ